MFGVNVKTLLKPTSELKDAFLKESKMKIRNRIKQLFAFISCVNYSVLKPKTKQYIVKFIEIEITLENIYVGNPKFFEIDLIMNENNFFIYRLGEFSYENQSDKLRSFDALYMKRG